MTANGFGTAACLSPTSPTKCSRKVDLIFKVGGKMFATLVLEPGPVCLAFKCSPEDFEELIEPPDIIPAPYAARAKWVALETLDAMPRKELAALLKKAYELTFAKLPKKTQRELS